jgi:hypothetical protein
MPVDTPSSAHTALAKKRERCRDLMSDGSTVSNSRYQSYVDRGFFYNAFSRTVEGLAGLVFQKDLDVNVPPEMEGHINDITMTGETLGQFSQDLLEEDLVVGGYGILVEMPADGAEDQRPYWVRYMAEQVISVRRQRIGGAQVLTRVVVAEQKEEPDPDDPFATKIVDQFRVLSLGDIETEDGQTLTGIYTQSIWRKNDRSEWVQTGSVIPTRRGEALTFIPFVVPPDKKPPLLDLADVNLSHYRTMADLEHGLHFVGVPQVVLIGATTGPGDEQLRFGAGTSIDLPIGGDAKVIQADGELMGALERADQRKRGLMATLGARLLEDQPTVQETATAVTTRHFGQHASLRKEARDVEDDVTLALQYHGWWVGTETMPSDVEASAVLNQEFIAMRMSPQELQQLLLTLQSGEIAYETFYHNLQEGGVARPGVSAEEEREAISQEGGGEDMGIGQPAGVF